MPPYKEGEALKFWGQSAQEKKVRTWAIVSLVCGCILLLFLDPLIRENLIIGFIIEFCGIWLIICSCLCAFGQILRMDDAGYRYYTILAFTFLLINDVVQPAYLSLFLLLKPNVVSVILLNIVVWCVFVLAFVYVNKNITKTQKASNAQQSPQARIQEQVPSSVIMQKILDNTAICEEMTLDVLITHINEPELTTKELLFKYIEYMLHHGLIQGDLTPDHFKQHNIEHEPSKEIIQKILAYLATCKEESLEVMVTQISEPELPRKDLLHKYIEYMLHHGLIQGDLTPDHFKQHNIEHEPSKEIIQKILAYLATCKEESLEVMVTQINEPALTQKAMFFAYLRYMLNHVLIKGDLTKDFFKRTFSPDKRTAVQKENEQHILKIASGQQQTNLDVKAIHNALTAGPKTYAEIAKATGLKPIRIYTLMFIAKGSPLRGQVGRRLLPPAGKNSRLRVQFFLKETALHQTP